MPSILTNTSAMTALQVLNANNRDLSKTEQRISTGLKVSSAKDDGATYAIAQNMRAQTASWQVVNDSLNRAKSLLDITQSATETISDLLVEMKSKAVSLQDTSLDTTSRTALQNDLVALKKQLDNTVQNATFNGINLLNGTDKSIIDMNPQSNPVYYSAQDVYGTDGSGAIYAATPKGQVSVDFTVTGANGYYVGLMDDLDGDPLTPFQNDTSTQEHVADGKYVSKHHVVSLRKTDTVEGSVAVYGTADIPLDNADLYSHPNFKMNAAAYIPDVPSGSVSFNSSPDGDSVSLNQIPMSSSALALDNMDFNDPDSVAAKIEMAFNYVNQRNAYFGTQSNAVDTTLAQNTKLIDTLNAGIGNLVDADMAKESATLQAQQVQQQLATQTLSIANQQPDWILDLFK